MEIKFEEKEQYTLDEVKAILEGVKGQIDTLVSEKDNAIAELTKKVEGIDELNKSNHELQVKTLALENNISDDLFDLIQDEDLEIVKNKIELVKNLKKVDVDDSFKPNQNQRKDDAYETALKNRDVDTALKSKFGRLFG